MRACVCVRVRACVRTCACIFSRVCSMVNVHTCAREPVVVELVAVPAGAVVGASPSRDAVVVAAPVPFRAAPAAAGRSYKTCVWNTLTAQLERCDRRPLNQNGSQQGAKAPGSGSVFQSTHTVQTSSIFTDSKIPSKIPKEVRIIGLPRPNCASSKAVPLSFG